MSFIVETPEPPYYAVIAPIEWNDDVEGFPEMADKLVELAQGQEGFIGMEMTAQDNCSISVSYWESMEAIQNWAKNADHLVAKKLGREKWFSKYKTHIAKVERSY